MRSTHEFRDHLHTVRRLPAFTGRAASEEMGRNLVKLVEFHKGTGGQIDPALTRWLMGLSSRTREKLVSIGLLERERVAVAKPLSEHLRDFAAALKAQGSTADHVAVVTGRARRVIEWCGFRFYSDISASKVSDCLHGLRQDAKTRRGISARTFNFYLAAVKQFCRWMVKDRRVSESPVSHLEGLNVNTDRRHDRRALSVTELREFLDSTYHGLERKGLSGPERSMLYSLAVESGLRAGELRSLTRESFDLDADPPSVTVQAAYSKRRRQDTVPLRSELADDLRGFLATKAPAIPVFRLPDRKSAAEMFQADLAAVGIPYRDDAGLVADFHALRHTFISNLAAGGIHPKTAQQLARHSTITLTMDRYTPIAASSPRR
jgi:integrase